MILALKLVIGLVALLVLAVVVGELVSYCRWRYAVDHRKDPRKAR